MRKKKRILTTAVTALTTIAMATTVMPTFAETVFNGISYTGSIENVMPGSNIQFVADIESDEDATVIWQLIGNNSPDTYIDENGILHVAEDEDACDFLVTAQSKSDPTQEFAEIVSLYQEAEPTVTGIEITGWTPAYIGKTSQFTGTVYVDGDVSTIINWSVSGNEDIDTYIDADGVLHIGELETASKVTVTATAAANQAFSTSEEIDIEEYSAEHRFVNYISNGDATCTSDGTKTAKCEDCDETDTVTDEGSMLDHSFTNYVSNNDATCQAEGTKTAKCDNCDETDTVADEGSITEHSFTNYVSNDDATCTSDGTKTAICDYCDATDTVADEGSMLDHSFTNYVSNNDATCQADGTKTAKCDNCDETDTVADEGSMTEHSFTNYVSNGDATCTSDGTKTAICDYCDETDTVTDEGSMTEHSFTNYVSNGDATCSKDGTKTAKCDTCDETDTIADPNSKTNAHTPEVTIASKAPTCTEDGNTAEIKCSECGTTIMTSQTVPARGHKFEDKNYVSNNDATCTADGTETAKCTNCDETDTRTDEGSMLEHSFTDYVSNNDATCKADGTKTAKCDNCDATDTVADEGSMLEHSFTNYVSNNDATCTADGTKTAKCDNCDATDTVTDENTKLEHSFTNYVSNNDATCQADGTKTAKCDNCDETDTVADEGSMTEHSFTNYVSNGDATCSKDGTKTAKCDTCDETDTVADPNSKTNAHTPVVTIASKAPTCTEAGSTAEIKCSECGTTIMTSQTVPARGHKFEDKNYVSNNDATCKADGTETAKCANCDETDTRTDEGSMLEHSFTNYVSNGDATCTADGTKTAKCDNCDATDTVTDEGSRLSHIPEVTIASKAPTCTEDGNTAEIKCSKCGETVMASQTVPARGHKFEDKNYVSNDDATCTADGTETAKCTNCDETDTRTDEGSMLEHSFTDYVSNGDATCKADGTKTAKCDNCDATDTITDEGSRLSHIPEVTIASKAPTCTEDGNTAEIKCSKCGETMTASQTVPARGHKFEGKNYVSNDDATCTADGTETAKCTNCDETNTRTVEGSMLEHAIEFDLAVEATCTETGLTSGTHCSICKETLIRQRVVPALGHKVDDDDFEVAKEATCTERGSKTAQCEVCGETVAKGIPALGHEFKDEDYVLNDDATCTEDGTETAKCTRCDETDTRTAENSKTPHTPVVDEAVPATCEETGLTEGSHCGKCDAVITAQKTVPALGHEFVDDDYASNEDATCAKDGTETAKCTRCDETDTRVDEGSRLPHTPEVTIPSKAPTCTEEGNTAEIKCSECGETVMASQTVPARGHNFDDYTSNNDATCSADGTKTAKCKNCDETDTKTDEGSKLPHTPVVDEAVLATCTEAGKTEGSHCDVCSTVIKAQEATPAAGHLYDNNGVCTRCGSKTNNAIAPTNPTDGSIPTNPSQQITNPQTGDTNNMTLFAVIGGLAAALATSLGITLKKKRDEE